MKDVIGLADMTQGLLTSFVSDRFGNKNAALALNGGWAQVPPEMYFKTPAFSITVWIYPQQVSPYSRVIDFGNGAKVDNILIAFSFSNQLKPYFELYSGANVLYSLATSSLKLSLNQWQFIAVTSNGTNAQMFLNGQQVIDTYQSENIQILKRYNCYIGRSNWDVDGYSHSYLDDLRFYNKSLSQEEILELMNQNETGEKLIHYKNFPRLFDSKKIFLRCVFNHTSH